MTNTNATVFFGIITGIVPGVDTVQYSVTNGCGTLAASYSITVNALPNAGIIIGTDSVCVGASTTLTTSASGGVWSVSNTDAGIAGGVVTGVAAGIDTVTYLVTTTSCGSASATSTMTVLPLAVPGTISGSTNVCVGSQIVLTDSSAGAAGTWGITNPSATLSGDTVTGVTPGADTVTYSVTNSCGTRTATKTVFVIPQPNSGYISGPDSLCVNGAVTLSETVAGGTWTMSNANATVTFGVVTGAAPGLDTVIYTFSNYCGMIYSEMPVYIRALPVAGTIVGPDSLCLGASTTMLETSIYGSWYMTNGNATVSAISAGGLATGVAVGYDTLIYTVTNLCGTANDSLPVYINQMPSTPTFSGVSYVCIGGRLDTLSCSPTGGYWTTSNTNVLIIGDTAIGVTPGQDSIYYNISNNCGIANIGEAIMVYTPKQCDSIDSVMFVPTVAAGAAEVMLYPNPNSGRFSVYIPYAVNVGAVTVADIYGKQVDHRTLTAAPAGNLTFELEQLPAGTYFVKLDLDGMIVVRKFEVL